jgi:hypothetical protein
MNHGVVGAFPVLDPQPGSSVTGKAISVPLLGQDLAYVAATDELYAASGLNIVVLPRASTASGSVAPSRTITISPSVGLVSSISLFLDKANDILFVGGERTYDGVILAINHASTANGTVTPDRTMILGSGVSSFTVDTSRSLLYVVNSLAGVHVYQNAYAATGAITPSYTMNSVTGSGLALDASRDRLYVADTSRGIHIVSQASSSTSYSDLGAIAVANARIITLDQPNDRLYVGAYNNAYVLDNVSALSAGATVPGASITAAGSSIAGFAFP